MSSQLRMSSCKAAYDVSYNQDAISQIINGINNTSDNTDDTDDTKEE